MTEKLRILFVSQESADVKKVGGLGEVVSNLSRSLANRGHQVVVLMPSHGSEGGLKDLKLVGQAEHIKALTTVRSGVKYILLADDGSVLSNPIVYSEGLTEKKITLMCRAMDLVSKLIKNDLRGLDIVHVNDWHSVPVGAALRERFPDAAFLFQIHLYIGKWVPNHYLFEECLLNPEFRVKSLSFREAYDKANGILEKFGALIFDLLATVSKSYLEEIIKVINSGVERKSTFIYNGCDWSINKITSLVLAKHPNLPSSRRERRRYLLEQALSNLPPEEPVIDDDYLRSLVETIGPPLFLKPRCPAPLSDGPLVLTTGRVSRQKGFDVLLKAVKYVIQSLKEVKFLLLLLPIRGEEGLVGELANMAQAYPDNVRIVYGLTPSIFHLAHISADLFVAPSRWEPFGIMALEALSTGNPVVASKVGGLQEIVVDLRHNPEEGVGLLVPPEDPQELARAIISLVVLLCRSELLEHYSITYLKDLVYDNLKQLIDMPNFEKILRERCMLRVKQSFSWDNSAEMAERAYELALSLSSSSSIPRTS